MFRNRIVFFVLYLYARAFNSLHIMPVGVGSGVYALCRRERMFI